MQNYFNFFEKAINNEQCRSSNVEQVLHTALDKWGHSTGVVLYITSFFKKKKLGRSVKMKYATAEATSE